MKRYGSLTTRLLKTNIKNLNISFCCCSCDFEALHFAII